MSPRQAESSSRAPRLPLVAALILILGVFGGAVWQAAHWSRSDLRARILQREAEALRSVARYEIERARREGTIPLGEGNEAEAITLALLDTYNLDGALALQVFDGHGEPALSLPQSIPQKPLSGEELRALLGGEPQVAFLARADARNPFRPAASEAESGGPALSIALPFPSDDGYELLAAAKYAMDGTAVQAEFAALDRRLLEQGALSYATGALLIGAIAFFAWWRLEAAHRELRAKTARLERAYGELALAAKTSAVGAIASHLIHGLKNPLAGLRDLVTAGSAAWDEEDRRDAEAAARRMQNLVNEVVEALRVDVDAEGLEAGCAELVDRLKARFAEPAERRGVALDWDDPPEDLSLGAREANLAFLIVSNLLDNAIDATPPGGRVRLAYEGREDRIRLVVTDTGEGIDPKVRPHLFSPASSEKPDGAGIGLAISQQLARHLGGALVLDRSDANGAALALEIPKSP